MLKISLQRWGQSPQIVLFLLFPMTSTAPLLHTPLLDLERPKWSDFLHVYLSPRALAGVSPWPMELPLCTAPSSLMLHPTDSSHFSCPSSPLALQPLWKCIFCWTDMWLFGKLSTDVKLAICMVKLEFPSIQRTQPYVVCCPLLENSFSVL